MEEQKPKIILAINPGTRHLGLAVFEGADLIYTTIKVVKTKQMADKKVLLKLEGMILALIDDFMPDMLALEEPLPIQMQRSPLLIRMFNRISEIGKRENIEVKSYSPPVIRQFICQHEKPTKMQTALIIATKYYPWLYHYYEKDLKKKWWEEKYWVALFDAVALGLMALTAGKR